MNMSRKAAEITPEALWEMFQAKCRAAHANEHGDDDWFDRYEMREVDKIGADIEKVEFDFENCEFEHQHEFGQWEGMLGYRSLYPLSYIGVMAGGDWEYPVYFIIYLDQDGKTLRAYIPKDGNVWNHDTKSAFGNDHEADAQFIKKWAKKNRPDLVEDDEDDDGSYWEEKGEIMFDKEKMRADIQSRIEVVRKPLPKKVAAKK
jgi:hypothetical protein